MSNLLSLPQFPAGTVISLQSNTDWDDSFFVGAPGSPSSPITLSGALASETFTVASPGGVLPGMIAAGFGVQTGTTVSAVSSGSITLSQNATISAPNASISFYGPALDLTGISFSAEIRSSAVSPQAILSTSTNAGTMTNGGTNGLFGWDVPNATILAAPWPSGLAVNGSLSCVMDVVATDSTGAKVNLCSANGPITVNVSLSITR